VRMKIIGFRLVMAICLVACPIYVKAAEKGQVEGVNKQNSSAKSDQIHCYRSPGYFVVAKEVEGRLGTDFLVKYTSRADEGPPCAYVFGANDFEIKNEWAEYFAGLKDNLLILDSSTGPGPSGLTIWDLKKRKKVYEGSWSDPSEIKDNSLTYWTETGEATDGNCPKLAEWESHGLGAAIETRVILNLSNFTVLKTKETRCSPRQ
jgi:hypothetical protein